MASFAIKLASNIEKNALSASRIMTMIPTFLPKTRPAFVPPRLPEPSVRISLWKNTFPMTSDHGTDPNK